MNVAYSPVNLTYEIVSAPFGDHTIYVEVFNNPCTVIKEVWSIVIKTDKGAEIVINDMGNSGSIRVTNSSGQVVALRDLDAFVEWFCPRTKKKEDKESNV